MSATVLLTGFEPFGGEAVNPSWEAVRALDGARLEIPGHAPAVVVAQQLPCVFATVGAALERALERTRPTLAVCIGQAGGRADLSIERVALNVIDARIPDNAGDQPIDAPIVDHAPAAYFSTLPIKAMVHALRGRGIPASVSQTAGTFVCNHAFYLLAHYIAMHAPTLRGGFIHIPYLPEQAARHPGQPSLALDTCVAGLRIALETALAIDVDLREMGGTLS